MKIEIKVSMTQNEKAKIKVLETAIGDEFGTIPKMTGRWGHYRDGNISIVEQCTIDAIDIAIALTPKIKSLVTFLKSFFPTIKMTGKAYSQKWFDGTIISEESSEEQGSTPEAPKAEPILKAEQPKVESIPKAEKPKSKYIPSKSKPKTK